LREVSKEDIERFLSTGSYESDWSLSSLSGGDAREPYRLALVAAVQRRAAASRLPEVPDDTILQALVHERLSPLVRGLFPGNEQEAVQRFVERSVVFVTPANVEVLLQKCMWLHTAWSIANLYLGSLGAELLGPAAPRILGLSSDLICYVSIEYLSYSRSRFADFIVHEATHALHDCKRGRIGLRETRTRERLVKLEFRLRETFAHGCEAYSRIAALGRDAKERAALVDEYVEDDLPGFDEVDTAVLVPALREAAAARNGLKRILVHCRARSVRAAGVRVSGPGVFEAESTSSAHPARVPSRADPDRRR
jgi:hypothetical protein